jgi:hypothetical protein
VQHEAGTDIALTSMAEIALRERFPQLGSSRLGYGLGSKLDPVALRIVDGFGVINHL